MGLPTQISFHSKFGVNPRTDVLSMERSIGPGSGCIFACVEERKRLRLAWRLESHWLSECRHLLLEWQY